MGALQSPPSSRTIRRALPSGADAAARARLIASVKRLHRLYQITPDDESLQLLAREKIDSSNDVASFSREEFVGHLTRTLDPRKDRAAFERAQRVAEDIHAKALQVDAAGRLIVVGLQQVNQTLPTLALAQTSKQAQAATAALVRRFPTITTLLGNQHYCECEHCRSVLSPAAYFVDLLRFVDPEKKKWDAFVQRWSDDHGAPYPHQRSGVAATPYVILTERRPDLPQLALTCDNTNIALPYVDLVNEILENYIDGGLVPSAKSGDSGGQTTADLIAEPQTLIPGVYETLRTARFPLALPFDLWTAAARAFCGQFNTPFWQLLETFRTSDGLFDAETDPAPFNTASVLAEKLGVSRSELMLLTGAGTTIPWFGLYGFPDETAALAGLGDAKRVADRLGVTYRELVDLIATEFINPSLGALRALHRLDVTAEMVFRYKAAAGFTPMTADERQVFEARLAALGQQTGENVAAWLDARWTAGDFGRILLLRAPASSCDPAQSV